MSDSTLSSVLSVKPIPTPPKTPSSTSTTTAENAKHFQSVIQPSRMGNTAPIAYGGCTLAVALHAAHLTLPTLPSPNHQPSYALYSAQGSYLSGAQTDRPYYISVSPVRDTKTFATRLATVYQLLDDGNSRNCMVMLADYQRPEPASLLTYSAPSFHKYSSPSHSQPIESIRDSLLQAKKLTQEEGAMHAKLFGLMPRYFESRPTPQSVGAQNLYGFGKSIPTTQDGLHLTDRTTADWIRARQDLTPDLQTPALGFVLDAGVAFAPLTLNKQFLGDAGACSSLDFSIRCFENVIDLAGWHLRETRTARAGNGRTYSEMRLWDEQGRMVGNMTQQSILRPKL